MAARTEDAAVLKIWRKIARELKNMTTAGSWAVDPRSGAKAFYRDHRYTESVRSLERKGFRIISLGGGSLMRFRADD